MSEAKYSPKTHLNLKISKKDWCKTYRPETCRIDQNMDRNLCLYCEHRRLLNIPEMINDWEKENR